MKNFIDMAMSTSGGASLTSVATGQLVLAIMTFIFFVIFGAVGVYLRIKDSRALHRALENGDLKRAMEIKNKE